MEFLHREVDEVSCETWWRPGVALIGEALHAMNPEAGIGSGLGIGDAYALGVAIGRNADDPDVALAEYERRRRPAIAPYLAVGSAGVRVVRGGSCVTRSAGSRRPDRLAGSVTPGAGADPQTEPDRRAWHARPGSVRTCATGASVAIALRDVAPRPGRHWAVVGDRCSSSSRTSGVPGVLDHPGGGPRGRSAGPHPGPSRNPALSVRGCTDAAGRMPLRRLTSDP